MADTARYALPLLQAGQAQKEITHNDAVARIDALLHLAVDGRRSATVPASGVWLVPTGATGVWAGHVGQIAVGDASGWTFIAPRDGCLAFVRDENLFTHFVAGAWIDAWPVSALAIGGQTLLAARPRAVAAPSGGGVVDAEARAALGQLLAALRDLGLLASA